MVIYPSLPLVLIRRVELVFFKYEKRKGWLRQFRDFWWCDIWKRVELQRNLVGKFLFDFHCCLLLIENRYIPGLSGDHRCRIWYFLLIFELLFRQWEWLLDPNNMDHADRAMHVPLESEHSYSLQKKLICRKRFARIPSLHATMFQACVGRRVNSQRRFNDSFGGICFLKCIENDYAISLVKGYLNTIPINFQTESKHVYLIPAF